MKKLREKLAAKWIAGVLFVVAFSVAVASGLGIIFLEEYHGYQDPSGYLAREQILDTVTQQNINQVDQYYRCTQWDNNLYYYEHYFDQENTNFFFRLYDADGEKILENYWTKDAIHTFSETISYTEDVMESKRYPGEIFTWDMDNWNEDKGVYEYRDADGKLLYTYDEDGGLWDMEAQNWGSWYYEDNQTVVEVWQTNVTDLTVEGGVAADLHADDDYTLYLTLAEQLLPLRHWLIAFLAIAALAALGCLIFLLWAVGHKEGVAGIYLAPWHRLPLDLAAVIVAAPTLLGIYGLGYFLSLDYFLTRRVDEYDAVILFLGITIFLVTLLMALYAVVTLTVRIKAGKWWRNTLIYRVLHWLWRGLRVILKALPLVWKTALLCAGMLILEIIGIALCWYTEQVVLLTLVKWVILMPLLILAAVQMRRLQKAGEALAAGDLNVRTDTSKLVLDFKKHGENLNRIGDGMNAAVDARMRSERLKTELITNVSHDLKTPLTSIVNYVDLMDQLPGLQPEEAKAYLEVLRRQSSRLKKLTEDLVEASKASSGAMPVNLNPTNLHELLRQATGEYEEKLAAANLQLMMELPPDCTVMADGRLLWRVLDNLLNNCCKYAMPGTRVYLHVTTGQTRAAIFVKNVSREVLNIDPDTLMERFVRADASRSTEGSGLGLSIARSLTELQHGTFGLRIDGDLFKVELTLPICNGIAAENGEAAE